MGRAERRAEAAKHSGRNEDAHCDACLEPQPAALHPYHPQGGGRHQGSDGANWATIAAVKRALRIPVVSNGNVRCFGDVKRCLASTGCDGVMSGCGLLADPTLFAGSCGGSSAGGSSAGGSSPGGSSPGGDGRSGSRSASEGQQGCRIGHEDSNMSGQAQHVCCSAAPPPSVAVAIEYVRFAHMYSATHQQVTKHLSAYLGPVLKSRPLLRAQILAFRGGELASTNRQEPKRHLSDHAPAAEAKVEDSSLARTAAFEELCALLEELEHELACTNTLAPPSESVCAAVS